MVSAAEARIVLVTAPDLERATALARELVARQLVACVNIVPAIHSIYRWKGAVEEAHEVLLIAKTTLERYPEFERALGELHPYEVPECVALEPSAVRASYLAWLVDETRAPR